MCDCISCASSFHRLYKFIVIISVVLSLSFCIYFLFPNYLSVVYIKSIHFRITLQIIPVDSRLVRTRFLWNSDITTVSVLFKAYLILSDNRYYEFGIRPTNFNIQRLSSMFIQARNRTYSLTAVQHILVSITSTCTNYRINSTNVSTHV